MRILFTTPDASLVEPICDALSTRGHLVDAMPCSCIPRQRFRTPHDLVIADLPRDEPTAGALLDQLFDLEPVARVIAIGERFSLHSRITAAERGVLAFVSRPLRLVDLMASVDAAALPGTAP